MDLQQLNEPAVVSRTGTAEPWLARFMPVLAMLAVCWLVFLANTVFWHGHLNQFGIRPRQISGVIGILWAPFLHASFKHLAANSLPLLILGGILCARSKSEFVWVAGAGTVLAGSLTWLLARNAVHIGASGLIFCFFGYLASLAYFKRTIPTLILSLICIVGYGGMLRGLLPTSAQISWEGHLAGLLAGITLAWLSSNRQPDGVRAP
jgi:membrane associated rhomboid family serine protease